MRDEGYSTARGAFRAALLVIDSALRRRSGGAAGTRRPDRFFRAL